MFSKSKVKPKVIASLIGGKTVIDGNLSFSGGIRIDGVVNGSVTCQDENGGMVVVSETGRIHGEVLAAHLIVSGHIVGPVTAVELIELQPKARIVGDVRYRALEMHHGAVVQGLLIHVSADGQHETPLQHEVNVPVASGLTPE